jgi:CRISPR/Cas system CSM-associated protein Csm2 small subunit
MDPTNKQEFDEKLQEIGDCYEDVKDILNALVDDMKSEQYERGVHAVQRLRDIAATQLRQFYEQAGPEENPAKKINRKGYGAAYAE